MKLNLACGAKRIAGAVNVDIHDGQLNGKSVVDVKLDILKDPFPWENVDEIYLLHVLEHFTRRDAMTIIRKCHAVLKRDGLIHIQTPHGMGCSALNQIDHLSTWWRKTFLDLCTRHHNPPTFMKPLFYVEHLRIHYLCASPIENTWVDFEDVPHPGRPELIRKAINVVMTTLINACPTFFERFWGYWCGGAGEIVFRGRKA